ncbi:AsmA family protein [Vibrio sp. WXL103]|uniref:AsmA family protein n=1 Tax=Vibrio sp. WXL103 TaxID=3450710 RepID=UPI003EC53177
MKKLLIILGVLVVIVTSAIIALVTLVNPNQFKPLIVEQVEQHTGMSLVIDGDISWQFFPSVGLAIGRTELRNPEGFSQANLFEVDQVKVNVSVMPLFDQRLEIGNVVLDGANIAIERRSDGSSNLDALMATSEQPAPATQSTSDAPSATSAGNQAWDINLAGITISNAAFMMTDAQAGQDIALSDVNLRLTEFAFGQWSKLEASLKGQLNQQTFSASARLELLLAEGLASYQLREINLEASMQDPVNQIERAALKLDTFAFDQDNALSFELIGRLAELGLNTTGSATLNIDQAIEQINLTNFELSTSVTGDDLPVSPLESSLSSDIQFDVPASQLEVALKRLSALDTELMGSVSVGLSEIAKIRFDLQSPKIDLDALLPEQESQEQASSGSTQSEPAEEVEPDLSGLQALDLEGKVSIGQFKASNVKLSDIETALSVSKGVAKLSSFSANLYQGSVKATGQLNANKSPATYSKKATVTGVQVQPLLTDAADVDLLEGTGNIDIDVKGKSLTPTGIKQNLAGTVAINFADGAVNGINVAQLIRQNYARFTGKQIDDVDGPQKTDFSAMTATLKLNQGVVKTNDLAAQSPLLRVSGEGQANYIKESMDMTISTSIVGSLKGQGGEDIDELKDVTIPIRIHGEWAEPKFALVFDDVMKQKAQQEIDRGLKRLDEKLGDKIKDEKTRKAVDGLLKGLFN